MIAVSLSACSSKYSVYSWRSLTMRTMSMLSEVMHNGESSCRTSLNFSDWCDIVCLFATNLQRIYIYAKYSCILRASNRYT